MKMDKKTINILAIATGVVVGYFAFCKMTKQSGAKSLTNASEMDEEDLGKEETPISGGGGGGGMLSGAAPVMGTPVYQNYPAPLPPITINTPPTMVISPSQLTNAPSVPSGVTSTPPPISSTTSTKDVPTVVPTATTKPMVSSITNPTTAAKFSGFMEFDGNDKFMNELL